MRKQSLAYTDTISVPNASYDACFFSFVPGRHKLELFRGGPAGPPVQCGPMPPLRPTRAVPLRVVRVGGRTLEVVIRRHPRARRYTLRLGTDGRLCLTVPRWASIGEGLRFVSGQADWIQRERLRHAVRDAPWRDGTVIWYRGERVPLAVAGSVVQFGSPAIVVSVRDGDVRASVEAHLRAGAAAEFPARCRILAARCGLTCASVRVRSQRSRWGACSSRGAITLNWRLIQMPAFVADYVIFHELMHLRQPNHSRRFWREVAAVCPDWQTAERWLKRWGRDVV